MKFGILILAASLFSTLAHARTMQTCAFGESTGELVEMLEYSGKGKVFYQSEHLSLHKQVRIKGITETEKKMILISLSETAAGNEGDEQSQLKRFSGTDGYITYFSHNDTGREFAAVASFPGDNEFGLIIELKKLRGTDEYTVLSIVAHIEDGDISKCTFAGQ